ncbi:cytochrome P450 family protein [Actinocrispum wychmicini]|uniref:Cytochrome P450 n=1 Tax=Actinocrispum wychmicini TaxID=1213861 RepID=A0A4R2JJF2_9PSEU|nr:cytochrome P450 [Actinocrispum wychmicini]TCO56639.1 cytochrome P450 [Actinocrispum wychmicini]
MSPVALDDDFIQNPYALYDRLRRDDPITQAVTPRGMRLWLVTRYDEARAVLTDPSVSKAPNNFNRLFAGSSSTPQMYSRALVGHMLNSDPPDHTRLRKLVTKAFTPGTVERLRPRIEQITDELLDAMAEHDQVDLLDAYAFPLPVTVICELLGVPRDDRNDFREWSNTLLSADQWEKVAPASTAMTAYLANLIAAKRATPGGDMLTDLVHASDEGDRLSEQELVAMAFLLLVAGHETTVNLIGNAVYALLRNPEQLARLRANPSLLPNAVEEFLRFDSPVDLTTMRITTAPVKVGAVLVPADEVIMVSLVSANRDLARFGQADQLDVGRKAAGHLAFGHGIHYCLGAPLARLEGQLAIGKLINRFPGLALAADPAAMRWRFSTLMHGLEALPVSLTVQT